MTSRMLGVPARMATVRSMPVRCRRAGRAVLERLEQVAELFLRFLRADAQRPEHRGSGAHGGGSGCAAADLPAVHHQVVRLRTHAAGVALQQVPVLVHRRCERVMHGGPALLVRAHSSSGNSTTQHSACTSPCTNPNCRPRCSRSSPRLFATTPALASATTSTRSPVPACAACAMAASSPSVSAFADARLFLAVRDGHETPGAPAPATSARSSSCLRL